jgi:uncharacterized protein (DUF885 family)
MKEASDGWRTNSQSYRKRQLFSSKRTKSLFVVPLAISLLAIQFVALCRAQKGEHNTEMSAAEFPSLVREYVDDLHARHPVLAAASGIHTWDSRLEDFSPAAISSEVSAIKGFQSRLENIPPLGLRLSDMFDYQIIDSNMKSRLLELEQIRSYERNPQAYNDLMATSLLQLTLFEYAPAEVRLRHVIAKEKLFPRLLEDAQSDVRKPPPILVKVAIDNFKALESFIGNDLPRAFAAVKDAKLQSEFKSSTKVAADSIAKYLKHLRQTKPDSTATYSIGKQNYELRLRYDEGINVPVDDLLKLAYRELEKNQEAFRQAAARIDPNRPALQVWSEIQKEHPAPGTLVAEAGKQLGALVHFIKQKNIVTLPSNQTVQVAATPDFLRWSSATMWTPGPFEKSSLPSRYLITDVDPGWSEKQKEEYLSSVNYPQLWTTSIHEAYPGHFVQGEYLKRVTSLVRRTAAFAPGTFVEGWAHYTEQMMLDEGFGDNDPKLRLGQIADALLRLCRFVVGIRLHTEGLTVDQGTIFFMQNAYMAETPARIEAERGTFDPLYLVYSLGKLAILKLREDYRHYRGADFSLQEFHDRLLSDGSAPIWVHRQMLMPGDKGKLLQ